MNEDSHDPAARAVRWSSRTAAYLALAALPLATAASRLPFERAVAAHDEQPGGLLIANVRVFDVSSGTFSDPASVLIRDGRIHAVGPLSDMDKPKEQIDARGAFALPGLWDSHVHLDFASLQGPDAVRKALEGFVQAGVTYVRDVGGPLETVAAIRRRVQSGDVVGPEVFFSGPLAERPPLFWGASNEKQPGTTVPIESAAQVDRLVASVAKAGGSFVKTFGKWDLDLFKRLVAQAREAGLEVVVDPGPPFFQEIPIDIALAAGARSIEHAHNAWQGALPADLKAMHDRLASSPDPAAQMAFIQKVLPLGLDALDVDAVRAIADRMVDAGAYFCPTLQVVEAWRVAHPSFPGFVPEDPKRHWNGFADVATRITQIFAERGVKLLIGQDGADPAGTAREMELLVRIGVPPVDVLRAATLHPAQWLKRDGEMGSLEVGRRADLVLVRADPLADMTTLRAPVLVVQAGTIRRGGNITAGLVAVPAPME